VLEKIKEFFTHKSLREFAHTLNCFNIIEIFVVLWLTYEIHVMLEWYRDFITLEHFNGVAYWGAIAGIIAGIIGALKYISDTLKNHNKNG
jgi:membrane associated rhomboid family serine protease